MTNVNFKHRIETNNEAKQTVEVVQKPVQAF